MEQSSILRFLKRKVFEKDQENIPSGVDSNTNNKGPMVEDENVFDNNDQDETSPTPSEHEFSKDGAFDLNNLPMDPGERKPILEYPPHLQNQVRKYYITNAPIQPRSHKFPRKLIGGKLRRFNPSWFDKHGIWLEYSIKKDAVFCLCCYLFANVRDNQCGDFVKEGFSAWNKAFDRFNLHIGAFNSTHNQALRDCEVLKKPEQSIQVAFDRHSNEIRKEYRLRLDTSVSCSRYLLRQGLSFRGHDESDCSENKGNFLELIKFAANLNSIIANVVLDNAPKNNQLLAPSIQKDIVNAAAKETLKVIMEELKDDFFGLLVDESGDISHKEQMAVVFRYVDRMGILKERFVGVVHVRDTSSSSLKVGIDSLLSNYSLSLSKVRAQGYDGASNMQGKFRGLKSLILNENKCAYSIHCFSHQLQLTLVALARDHDDVGKLFDSIAHVLNVVGASCKRHDMLREQQVKRVKEALNKGEIESGRGLNQELAPIRAGDTRWGSHYKSLMNVISLFSSIIDVLEFISIDGETSTIRNEAKTLMTYLRSFDFVFTLYLMVNILGITHDLSMALQRKEQNIVNAVRLVETTKKSLQAMRDGGWDLLMEKVCLFCKKHDIDIPNMDDTFVAPGRPRRVIHKVLNLHHYRADIFYSIIDLHQEELRRRFDEANTELLSCIACLSPCDGFTGFDQFKLIKFAQFYPDDFSEFDIMALEHQLANYILDVQSLEEFQNLIGLGDLCRVMVETKKDITYPLVFLLVKLSLILPVSTATVERAFSAMNIVKSRLRNRMCDQFLNDCLVCYIEKDVFDSISNDSIMYRFQAMKTRRGQM